MAQSSAMDRAQPPLLDNDLSLHDFLTECELQQYFGVFRNRLKVATVEQLKYVRDSDFDMIGMSRPEQRRLLKLFHKLSPQSYIGRMKKIINTSLQRRNSSLGPDSGHERTSPNSFTHDTSCLGQPPPLPARRRRHKQDGQSAFPSGNDHLFMTPSTETSLLSFGNDHCSSNFHTPLDANIFPLPPAKRRTKFTSFSTNTTPVKQHKDRDSYHIPIQQQNTSSNFVASTQNVPAPSPLIAPYSSFMSVNAIGTGQFSTLSAAVWQRPNRCDAEAPDSCQQQQQVEKLQVAIKRTDLGPIVLQIPEASFALNEFVREARRWHALNHAHLVKLYALSFDNCNETPNSIANDDENHKNNIESNNVPLLILELAPMRSLLECLKEPSLRYSFPIASLCELAGQVCSAMAYLEAERVVHNNLCLNNVMVFTRHHVKVTDIGLLRASLTDNTPNMTCECDKLDSGRHRRRKRESCCHGRRRRRQALEPFCYNTNTGRSHVAWLAPELIQHLRIEDDTRPSAVAVDQKTVLGSEFTHASDVYAFGTTLWEMFGYGSLQPWPALSMQQVLNEVLPPKAARLDRPDLCSVELYTHVILPCWQHAPENRPNFSAIQKLLYEYKPQQVEAVRHSSYTNCHASHIVSLSQHHQQTNLLFYRRGDVITVLDKKPSEASLWHGALASGKCGLFDPSNTAAYMNGLSSNTLFDMNNTSYYSHKQQQQLQNSFIGSRSHVPRILAAGGEARVRCNSSNSHAFGGDLYAYQGLRNDFIENSYETPATTQQLSAAKNKRSRSFHNPLMLRRTGSKLSLKLVNAVVGGLSRSRSRLSGSTCQLDAATTTPDVISKPFCSAIDNTALSFQLKPARSVSNLVAVSDHAPATPAAKHEPQATSMFSPASRCQSSIDSNVPPMDFPTRLLELLNMSTKQNHSTYDDSFSATTATTALQHKQEIGNNSFPNNNFLNLSNYFQSDVISSTSSNSPPQVLQPYVALNHSSASVVAVDSSDSSSSLSSSFRSRMVNNSGEVSSSSKAEEAQAITMTDEHRYNSTPVAAAVSSSEDAGRKSPACDSGLTTSTSHTQTSSSSSSSSTSSTNDAVLHTHSVPLEAAAIDVHHHTVADRNKTMVTDLDNLPAIDDTTLPWAGTSPFVLDNGSSLLDEVFQALEISAGINGDRLSTAARAILPSSAVSNAEFVSPAELSSVKSAQSKSRSIETPLDSMVSTLMRLNQEHERTRNLNRPRRTDYNVADDEPNILPVSDRRVTAKLPLRKVISSGPTTSSSSKLGRSQFYYPNPEDDLISHDQLVPNVTPLPVPNTTRPNHSLIKTCHHFSLRVASSVSAAFSNNGSNISTRLRRNGSSRLSRAGSVESSSRSVAADGNLLRSNSPSSSSPRLIISQPMPLRIAAENVRNEQPHARPDTKPSSFTSLMSRQSSEKQQHTNKTITAFEDPPSIVSSSTKLPAPLVHSKSSRSENRRAARLAALQLAVGGIATRVATTTASNNNSEESDVCLVFADARAENRHHTETATSLRDDDDCPQFVINQAYEYSNTNNVYGRGNGPATSIRLIRNVDSGKTSVSRSQEEAENAHNESFA